MKIVKKASHGFFLLIEFLLVFISLTMVLLVFSNVVLRYLFSTGIDSAEEISRWLFVWLVFLGAIIVLKENKHLGTDVAITICPKSVQQVLRIASQIIVLACILTFFWGSYKQLLITLDVESPVTGLSMGILYFSGLVFSFCSTSIILSKTYKNTKSTFLRKDQESLK